MQYILVKKKVQINNKKFDRYALRTVNDSDKWLSANLSDECKKKLESEKVEQPYLIDLNEKEGDYFISSMKKVNDITGEASFTPKVVITNYRSVEHAELEQQTIEEAIQNKYANK